MNKYNLVSIIMNCHNGEKYIKEAINSLINQSYKNWELIFFDNASNDNSAVIAKKYDLAFENTEINSLYTYNGKSSYHLYVIQINFDK